MSTYNDIRQALGAAIISFRPELNVFHYVPRSFDPPVAIVQPEMRRTIDYQQVMGSFANWYFNVLIVVGELYEEAAQEIAGDLISPTSPLICALQEANVPYIQVVDAAVSEQTFKTSAVYTLARVSLLVRA